jgi:ferric-dicitrate binding protein FerR (iron transport regulator)
MHRLLRNGAIVAGLILLAAAQAVGAADATVRIDRIAGTVEVNQGGKWTAAKRGMDLGPGWQLRTGADSKALLAFPAGNTAIIKANSVLTVDKLDLKGTKLKLDSGGLLADLKSALSPGSQFAVESAGALAAVRGTQFAVDYRTNDAGEGIVWFCCFRGAVELSNEHGPAKLLESGNFVTVKPGSAVPDPKPSTPKAQDFLKSISDLSVFDAAEAKSAEQPAAMDHNMSADEHDDDCCCCCCCD